MQACTKWDVCRKIRPTNLQGTTNLRAEQCGPRDRHCWVGGSALLFAVLGGAEHCWPRAVRTAFFRRSSAFSAQQCSPLKPAMLLPVVRVEPTWLSNAIAMPRKKKHCQTLPVTDLRHCWRLWVALRTAVGTAARRRSAVRCARWHCEPSRALFRLSEHPLHQSSRLFSPSFEFDHSTAAQGAHQPSPATCRPWHAQRWRQS